MKSVIRFVALALLPAVAAPAQMTPPGDPNTLTLTEAQKQELLAHNTEDSVDAARAGLGNGAPGRQIHGEIGAMVGTHGARSVYGTAAIPLGNNVGAVVSFEDSHYSYGRHR